MKPEDGGATASQAARRSVHAEMSTSVDSDGVTAAAASDAASSLGDDTLIVNLGIPVIVVLTKVCLHLKDCVAL